MFLHLHTKTLFGNETQALAAVETKTVTKCIGEKYAHLKSNNFFTHLEELLKEDQDTNQVKAKMIAALLK
jgi:hypothetical protein